MFWILSWNIQNNVHFTIPFYQFYLQRYSINQYLFNNVGHAIDSTYRNKGKITKQPCLELQNRNHSRWKSKFIKQVFNIFIVSGETNCLQTCVRFNFCCSYLEIHILEHFSHCKKPFIRLGSIYNTIVATDN